MLEQLDRHPHARAVLAPALSPGGRPSHAYLFHGPGGAGKRSVARAVASELLADGSSDPDSARARALSGVHPDLTWVAPSGAHEILVSDIDEPVISAASKTPFESSRRVFVIERVDELGDEAANRMLKTLEEPAAFVHLILLTDRLVDVLPTIRSRCQLVRFDAPPIAEVASEIEALGVAHETAVACARLSLGDAERAHELALEEGRALRAAAERFARAAIAGSLGGAAAVDGAAGRGPQARETRRAPSSRGVPPPSSSCIRGRSASASRPNGASASAASRRRVETSMLDLGLQLVALWYADLACLAWGAEDLVRNVDRLGELQQDSGLEPGRLRAAIELVEDTRQRFQLNVTEELACEALAYRLEHALAS